MEGSTIKRTQFPSNLFFDRLATVSLFNLLLRSLRVLNLAFRPTGSSDFKTAPFGTGRCFPPNAADDSNFARRSSGDNEEIEDPPNRLPFDARNIF